MNPDHESSAAERDERPIQRASELRPASATPPARLDEIAAEFLQEAHLAAQEAADLERQADATDDPQAREWLLWQARSAITTALSWFESATAEVAAGALLTPELDRAAPSRRNRSAPAI
ncbi:MULTISPECIES: hypothetical protein [Actinoplanes]|uniref:hypothetical protein n=1 Tax=Actinoplanes TaxID=1865 RepID=UPI0005F2E039|nr:MULTISPECIES: hypothetical protein [Actinoplanes]GLY08485.1 hypothetical protein Acsp01_88640 [Actinoplanes sp. NBRC 101535]